MPPDKRRHSGSTATDERPAVPGDTAFLLARFDEGTNTDFRKISPYKIRDHLVGILGQAVKQVTVSAIRSGALLLKTSSIEQTSLLMKWRSFGGLPLKVTPADSMNQVEGTVYAPELAGESVETILRESVAQGVTRVTRFPSKTSRPNPLLKLRFCRSDLPEHFRASYIRYGVRPYVPLPRRCPRCLRYGHGIRTCKAKTQRCKRCAGNHDHLGCEAPPRCAACRGDHRVTDGNCPAWLSRVESLRAKHQRPPNGSDQVEWPALAPPGSGGVGRGPLTRQVRRSGPATGSDPGAASPTLRSTQRSTQLTESTETSVPAPEGRPDMTEVSGDHRPPAVPSRTSAQRLPREGPPPPSDMSLPTSPYQAQRDVAEGEPGEGVRSHRSVAESQNRLTVSSTPPSSLPEQSSSDNCSLIHYAFLPEMTPPPPSVPPQPQPGKADRDSDDSTSAVETSDDESTPKATLTTPQSLFPGSGSDGEESDAAHTPPTVKRVSRRRSGGAGNKGRDTPTSRTSSTEVHVLANRLRSQQRREGRNMGYRTPPTTRRAFIPEDFAKTNL